MVCITETTSYLIGETQRRNKWITPEMRTALVNYFVYRLFFKPTQSLTHSCTHRSNVYFRHPATPSNLKHKKLSLAGFLPFLNTGYTKPSLRKSPHVFWNKKQASCRHLRWKLFILSISLTAPHIRFFLPALCNQFINNVSISFIPLIIRHVWNQLLDMTSHLGGGKRLNQFPLQRPHIL